MVGGMGHSTSVASGYALNSNKEVFCLDGDGSVLMHLGSMRTIGYLKTKIINMLSLITIHMVCWRTTYKCRWYKFSKVDFKHWL